jgi:adenine-specific DNA methylase
MKGAMNWDWTAMNAAMSVIAKDGYHDDVEQLYRSVRYLRAALMDHDASAARSAEHDALMLAAAVLARQAR